MKTILIKLIQLRLASIIICALFFLLSNMELFSQEHISINGRTLVKVNSQYVDITNSDTLGIDQLSVAVKFNTDQEHDGLNYLLDNFGCTMVGKLSSGYYILRLKDDIDLVEFLNKANQETSVSKTKISHTVRYCATGHNPVEQNTYQTWYFGEDLSSYPELQMYEYLCLEKAWDITTGDPDIIVGMIDSGTWWGQNDADFPPDNGLGYNYTTMSTNTHPTNNLHGTAMTSIISSRSNNGQKIWGVAGGWPAESIGITPMMVVNQSATGTEASWDNTALAIEYAANNNARIINLTMGLYENNIPLDDIQMIKDAIDAAVAVQPEIIIVCSAGNWEVFDEGYNKNVMFPANYPPVFAAGAADAEHHVLSYLSGKYGTSFGPELFCAAPGEFVYSNKGNSVTTDFGKTSAAATFVSGVISLMLSVNPCLTRDEVRNIIKQSSYKGGPYTYVDGRCDQMGYGFINAKNAVRLAMGDPETTITGTVTWSSNKTFRGNITIAPGAKLTLQDMTLKMWDNTGIIVSKNGYLNVVNSTITSKCDQLNGMWNGIIVQGDPTKQQLPFYNPLTGLNECYQGIIALSSNSFIKHAICGINFSQNGAATGGGGYVSSRNASFVNNTVNLTYAPYPNTNLSNITNTNFIIVVR